MARRAGRAIYGRAERRNTKAKEHQGHRASYLKKKDTMPTFSRSLEQSLHRALALANERHHEYATLEHLLLALLDDQDAAAVMRACNVDLDKLRRSLTS